MHSQIVELRGVRRAGCGSRIIRASIRNQMPVYLSDTALHTLDHHYGTLHAENDTHECLKRQLIQYVTKGLHSKHAQQAGAVNFSRSRCAGRQRGRGVTCSTSAAHLAGTRPSCLNARSSALRGSCGQHGEVVRVLAPSGPRLATVLPAGTPQLRRPQK